MNPPLHNRPGQSLPSARQGAHVPPLPLPSLSFSTTTTIFSLVPPDPETSPFEEYRDCTLDACGSAKKYNDAR